MGYNLGNENNIGGNEQPGLKSHTVRVEIKQRRQRLAVGEAGVGVPQLVEQVVSTAVNRRDALGRGQALLATPRKMRKVT